MDVYAELLAGDVCVNHVVRVGHCLDEACELALRPLPLFLLFFALVNVLLEVVLLESSDLGDRV